MISAVPPSRGRVTGRMHLLPSARTFLTALLPALLWVAACAMVTPGSDPIVVRTQDVLTNSLSVYEAAMKTHYAVSTQEPMAVYTATEQVRVAFPKAWRGLDSALASYKATKDKDPAKLRASVLSFLTEVEGLGPESWKASIQLIRRTFEKE